MEELSLFVVARAAQHALHLLLPGAMHSLSAPHLRVFDSKYLLLLTPPPPGPWKTGGGPQLVRVRGLRLPLTTVMWALERAACRRGTSLSPRAPGQISSVRRRRGV